MMKIAIQALFKIVKTKAYFTKYLFKSFKYKLPGPCWRGEQKKPQNCQCWSGSNLLSCVLSKSSIEHFHKISGDNTIATPTQRSWVLTKMLTIFTTIYSIWSCVLLWHALTQIKGLKMQEKNVIKTLFRFHSWIAFLFRLKLLHKSVV